MAGLTGHLVIPGLTDHLVIPGLTCHLVIPGLTGDLTTTTLKQMPSQDGHDGRRREKTGEDEQTDTK